MSASQTEPTNDELYAQVSNCCLSSAFNEADYAKPTKESVDKLAIMRSKRLTFIGIEDFLVRADVDRYLKEYTS
jgi:hypothetical protein